ncbi:hypothetical protein HID58_044842 [Brassica napus]|uniref:MYB-CC type transcription factor LHEQLE-containing domain-containing protein n=1 Tax=Brassica napus TaxID=3708 RepID=A0ABQ7XFY4_BRANA|nr:hypothetical protein HID58_044842 [Brassica napus]
MQGFGVGHMRDTKTKEYLLEQRMGFTQQNLDIGQLVSTERLQHKFSKLADPLDEFFDFSYQVPVLNQQAERVVSSVELHQKSEWQSWADQLIDNGSEPNGLNFLEIQVHRYRHHVWSYQGKKSSVQETYHLHLSNACVGHQNFMRLVEAVNQRCGSERATPKAVLNLLNNPGLTIYHLKSHLKKYRTARYKPETSEATEEPQEKKLTSMEDIKPLDMKTVEITQALRFQMEVQKRLHDQLEVQRSLQIQIEKQGRQL